MLLAESLCVINIDFNIVGTKFAWSKQTYFALKIPESGLFLYWS